MQHLHIRQCYNHWFLPFCSLTALWFFKHGTHDSVALQLRYWRYQQHLLH